MRDLTEKVFGGSDASRHLTEHIPKFPNAMSPEVAAPALLNSIPCNFCTLTLKSSAGTGEAKKFFVLLLTTTACGFHNPCSSFFHTDDRAEDY